MSYEDLPIHKQRGSVRLYFGVEANGASCIIGRFSYESMAIDSLIEAVNGGWDIDGSQRPWQSSLALLDGAEQNPDFKFHTYCFDQPFEPVIGAPQDPTDNKRCICWRQGLKDLPRDHSFGVYLDTGFWPEFPAKTDHIFNYVKTSLKTGKRE